MEQEKGYWLDEWEECLRLCIQIIPETLRSDTPELIERWIRPCRSSAADWLLRSKIGGLLIVPASRPTFHPNTNNGFGFLGQLLLSDFRGFLTSHGRLPSTGCLSFYHEDAASGQFFYDPDLDATTDYEALTPQTGPEMEGYWPCIEYEGFIEHLQLDDRCELYQADIDIGYRIISDKYDKEASRFGHIPIEKYFLVGGQSMDYQCHNVVERGDFQFLQATIDTGAMRQLFFYASSNESKVGKFNSQSTGYSYSK